MPYRTVGTSGSPVTNPGRWEGATEAGKGPAWPVSPERAASGLPASPPPRPRERPPCPLPSGTEVEWPRSGARIPTGSKPLCLTGNLHGRRPGRPSGPECISPGLGRPRLAPRPHRPSWPFPLRAAPTFPARGCAGAASHTGRGRAAAGPPALLPPQRWREPLFAGLAATKWR